MIYSYTAERVILRSAQTPLNYRTAFDKVGRVTYDKIKRTTKIDIYNPISSNAAATRAANEEIPSQLKGESKDDYSLRLEKYYNNKK